MKQMIDPIADFKPDDRTSRAMDFDKIDMRELALLIPAGRAGPGQISQLAAAATYAKSRGVTLRIYHGR